ncbi:Sensory/regulatory protein RpfC [Caulifigura coniformis]|uniref:histidine kinase n=1 Tax=Caulifigura coniformis TaxID=2527983 RepID=A0A517SML3_9PLAN|nr:ATP-binding protein [Caulifigura coniformis]QDT57355.1 Sensory/regulatory protein RpfC [Caulifigura coniformis]
MPESSLTIEALWILICATLMLLIQRGLRALDHGPLGPRRDHASEAVTQAVLQREQTMVALREAEARFRSIFENAVEGIFQTTPDGTYVIANPALAGIYGYDTPEELISGIGDISRQLYVDPERRNEFVHRIRSEGVVTDFESQVYRRDGSIIWIAETARAVVIGGAVARYEGTVVNITERKLLENLRRQKEAADAANHAKSSFLARVSHEIRTPLNGVIGMLEVLGGTGLATQQQQQVRIARQSAMSLLGLMNDLLDFSKIEAGRLELEQVPFRMRAIATEVQEAFAHVAAARQLELSSLVDDNVPEFLMGDPERVRQILVNLVNNALKFTERGSVSIHVGRERDGDGLTIRVKDTGIGIPESRRSRLFHDFMQVDASISRKYGGTGLGLAICRQLVELMNGRIDVESQVDVGSEFRVRLPLAATVAPESPAACRELMPHEIMDASPGRIENACDPVSDSDSRPATQGRLLLAEDNEINQMVAVELLRMAGWDVDVANNGVEAVASVQRSDYDAVLMDCQMPEMDGLTAAREIRLLEAAGRLPRYTRELIPIIAFTANAAPEDREQCLSAGMNAFAAKPLVMQQLLETIETVVGPARSRLRIAGRGPKASPALADVCSMLV